MSIAPPVVGGDDNTWGTMLLAWIGSVINNDGTISADALNTALAQVYSGAAASAGPIGDGLHIPQITTGPFGQIDAITAVPLAIQPFAPTLAQTADFTPNPFDWSPVNLNGGSLVASLPETPPNGSPCGFGVIKASGSNALTIQSQGDDIIQVAGSTSRTLSALDDCMVLQYCLAQSTWFITSYTHA